jgi:uncharacterized membrane protein YfcA
MTSTLLDPSLFASLVADRRFPFAIAIAAIAGLVRGFSGFGSALIHIPLIAALYNPLIAAVTIVLIDFAGAVPLSIREFSKCSWRDVLPVATVAVLSIPLGAMAHVLIEPVILRWFIAFLIFLLLVPLALGWRYEGKPRLSASVVVGLISGVGAGAVQIGAPSVVLYWLGTVAHVATLRANLMVYLLLLDVFGITVYSVKGLLTVDGVALAILLGPPFFAAMAAGAYFFHGSSDAFYRRVAYGIIALAAFLSLPLFDQFLR